MTFYIYSFFTKNFKMDIKKMFDRQLLSSYNFTLISDHGDKVNQMKDFDLYQKIAGINQKFENKK